jgi:polyprenyl P-hydroxybenzoate/phenylacrylic acid decarboxylase-like protein
VNRARRIVVAISGASGAIYARRMLALLAEVATDPTRPSGELELHWTASTNARTVWQQELGEPMPGELGPRGVLKRWAADDFAAPFASGSSAPDAVLVTPCSMSCLARVANGGGGDLIARTCEVALKERRPLVLVVRETPLSLVHLRNMVAATEAGAIVLPAVPSFYGAVETLEQAIDTVVVRALDRAGIRLPIVQRWGESTT